MLINNNHLLSTFRRTFQHLQGGSRTMLNIISMCKSSILMGGNTPTNNV